MFEDGVPGSICARVPLAKNLAGLIGPLFAAKFLRRQPKK
jgi:hypothetical protein